jgi:hypothetical protein
MTNCLREFAEIAIYSSETEQWIRAQSEWGYRTIMAGNSECVFLNGIMHLAIDYGSVLTVDMEGKVWGEIELLDHTPSSKTTRFPLGSLRDTCMHGR